MAQERILIERSAKAGIYWMMPVELSDSILKQRDDGSKEVSFVWDWECPRGTYWVDGEQTSINRYMINFDEMLQRNLDNDSWRKVKIIKITAE